MNASNRQPATDHRQPSISALSYTLGSKSLPVTDATLRAFGFRKIHVADGETAYDLAKRASSKLLRSVRLDPDD
ncbi:MAG TPA: hypothetical protein VIL97_03520, partial [Thermoanaerobaculia bacterium]